MKELKLDGTAGKGSKKEKKESVVGFVESSVFEGSFYGWSWVKCIACKRLIKYKYKGHYIKSEKKVWKSAVVYHVECEKVAKEIHPVAVVV